MFSLGMSIDSLSKSIYCNLNNNITCYNVVTYTATLYNHTIPNKGSQVIDSPDLTFEVEENGKKRKPWWQLTTENSLQETDIYGQITHMHTYIPELYLYKMNDKS